MAKATLPKVTAQRPRLPPGYTDPNDPERHRIALEHAEAEREARRARNATRAAEKAAYRAQRGGTRKVEPARPTLPPWPTLTDEERAELTPLIRAVERAEDALYRLGKRRGALEPLTQDTNPAIAQAAHDELEGVVARIPKASEREHAAKVARNRTERRVARAYAKKKGCVDCP